MLVFFLVTIIFIAAIFQKSAERRLPAVAFAFFTMLHFLVFSQLEGFGFFFTAGLCDVAIISVIATHAKVSRISDALLNVSVLSVFLNVYGFVLWVNYLPVISSNNSIIALYLITIFYLLSRDSSYEHSGVHQHYRGLRLLAGKCSLFRISLSGEKGL